MPVDPVRDAAVSALLRVFEAQAPVDATLDRIIVRGKLSQRGNRFLTHIVYGVVRHKLLCDHVLQGLCEQPLDKLPPPVFMVLRLGVFQALFCDNVTRPAMVHTAVELARRRGHPGLARLTNAVLRRVPKRLEDIALPDRTRDRINYLRLRYSMPRWIVRLWLTLYGEDDAERMCARCNEPAPPCLRVNTLKTDMETLEQQLHAAGNTVARIHPAIEGLMVSDGVHPLQSKRFQEGAFLVQDPASMLAARLTAPMPGERVLDLCAAPGGKATHLAALAEDRASVIALERYPQRIRRIRDNCDRLGVASVYPVCGDGLAPPFAEGRFDRVLVDAPCSGLGTLRRHPEIKWRTTPDTPARLAETQRALLRTAARLCKNGGLVVYSVCTLTREETLDVVTELLSGASCVPEDGLEQYNTWKTAPGQYQTSPLDAAWDGFFLMRFRKRS